MKKKLKGVLGIGLTLVLLASLTIGLAVPAAADPGTLKFSTLSLPKVGEAGDWWAAPGSNVGPIATSPDGDILFAAASDVFGLSLDESDLGSTEWSTDFALSGSCSAKLIGGNPQDGDDWAAVVIPMDGTMTLSEVTSFVYNYYFANAGNWGPHICFYTHEAGTPANTAEISLYAQGGLTPATAGWHTMTIVPATDYFFWYGDGTSGSALTEGLPSMYTLAQFQADTNFRDYVIDRIQVEYGWWGSGDASEPAYVDDMTINGAVYDAAPVLLFKSSDGGYAWKVIEGFDSVVDIVVSPDYEDDLTVFVATDYYVFQSVDGGKNFVRMTTAWTGETITDLDVALDGRGRLAIMVGTKGAPVGDVYVLSTATGMTWQAQGIDTATADYDVLAAGFSPFFADDEGIAAVVTGHDSFVAGNVTRVRFSFAYIGAADPSIGWGVDIGDANVQDAYGDDFASSYACIAFPDDFDAWGIGNNVCFVGIYAGTTGNPLLELGDVYEVVLKSVSSAIDLDIRGVITTLQPTATNIVSIDVCGDAEEASILVGTDYCSLLPREAYFLVYRSDDGGETWIPSGTKSPTGGTDGYVVFEHAWTRVLMSPDFLTDEIAYAATTGPGTSAFSSTSDSAATWNQIGLIDYGDVEDGYVIVDLDAAGYNADGTLHMTTQVGGTSGAVWNRTGGKNWERIWSYANPAVYNDIKELIINGDETMFAVDYAAEKMWRSSNMGVTWPKTITTKADLTEVCIVSPTTIYTGHTDGGIYWSTKSGTAWKKPEVNPNKGDIGGISVKGDYVLVGNAADGKVYFSSDGGETFERVGVTDPGLPGSAIVSYDLNFADNNIIYCVISLAAPTGFAQTGDAIYRTELDIDDPSDSEWVSIDDGTAVYLGPALALPPSGVLYATDGAEVNANTGGLWRCFNPTADVDSSVPPYFERENKGLDQYDKIAFMDVDVFPTTLFFSNQWGLTPAGYTTAHPVPYYQQIVMFTDTLDSGVSLVDPGDGAAGVGIIPAGDVSPLLALAWEEMAGATSYQHQVAYDSDFKSRVSAGCGFTTSQVSETLKLSPNKTYYWRVRVADGTAAEPIGAPLISPWSETWKFKTAIGATMARPELEAPEAGDTDVFLSPTFEWSGIEWAERYEFELSTGSSTTAGGYFTDVLVGLTGTNALVSTAWKCDIALDYEARYYWHVKAFGVDTETPWSDVGTFTTMGVAPAPPEPAPPVVIPPVEEITPVWLWVIIGIGAALMIAVIILIVTTRRVP